MPGGVDDVLQHVAAGAPARETDHRGPRHQVGIAPARRRAARAFHAARPPERSSGAARAGGGNVGSLCGHGGGLPGGGAGNAPRPPTKSSGRRRPRPPDAAPLIHAVRDARGAAQAGGGGIAVAGIETAGVSC